MKKRFLGIALMVGSFVIWAFATEWLFDYNVNVLYPEEAFGEPIWVIDPYGFMYVSVPTGLVFIFGLFLVCASFCPE